MTSGTSYRTVWTYAAWVVGVLLCLAAVPTTDSGAVAGLSAFAASVTALFAFAVRSGEVHAPDGAAGRRAGWSEVGRWSARSAAATACFVSLSGLIGVGAWLVALLAVASTPTVVAWLRRTSGARGPLRELSDRELCTAWRASTRQVVIATAPAQLMRLAQLREAILEEMERRCPAGFAAWLATGLGADDLLEVYLLRDGRGRGWDPNDAPYR